MIQGLIFDLDGVLTDTAAFHFIAWKRLADELGLHFTQEDNARLKGISRMRSLEVMLQINDATDRYTIAEKETLIDRKNDYYKAMIEKITPKDILPGIQDLLDASIARGLKLAVASASKNAHRVLERLDLCSYFEYIADARKIHDPKPHPEVFLDCIQALGLRPEACVGFEDALAGIQAIHAAGMFAVGIGVGDDRTGPLQSPDMVPDLILPGTYALDLDDILAHVQDRAIGPCS